MRQRAKSTIEFILASNKPITVEELAAKFGLTTKAAAQRLFYLYKIGVLSRVKEGNKFHYIVREYDAALHDRPYSVYKEKTPMGTIVKFGDKWRPEAAIRAKNLYGGRSSIDSAFD